MKIIKNGINAVAGITSLGKAIGIKKSGKMDFAVIYSDKIAAASGVFTKNKIKGAPVYVTKKKIKKGKAQAIVINSGIANVSTGEKGIKDAEEMANLVADELKINRNDVLVASTGVIGKFLPMEKIREGVKGIGNQLSKKNKAAEAIMTTDAYKKEIAVNIGNVTIGAIAKGAGMIHPNMATMLCFITTDAEIPSSELKKMLKNSVDKSFNMISVDNDTSTSDMVILMANGTKGKVNIKKFQYALDFVCIELAKKIAADGEGATKLIEVNVKNASSKEDAKKVAKSIITSNLVKCAFYGNDLNFGRVMCAIGNSNARFKEEKIDIFFENEQIVKNGMEKKINAAKIKMLMKEKKNRIFVNLNSGSYEATAWGSDLTLDYVKFNSNYHT